jgi:hypothetical protein
MDLTGVSSISNDNFDSDDNDTTAYTAAVDRFALYDALTNVDWDGCVESRPYPYDTDDTPPTAGVPDTFFVPTFAPDNPDSGGFSNNYISDTAAAACPTPATATFTWTQYKYSCNKDAGVSGFNNRKNNYNTATCDGSPSVVDSYETTINGVTTTSTTPPDPLPPAVLEGNLGTLITESYARPSGSGPSGYTNRRIMTWSYTMSARERQERLCKYSGSVSLSGGKDGPNGDCPTNAITPLTNVKATINSAITAMSPQGFTNIHQGSIWGLHVLTQGVPFTEGLPSTSATYKIMIVMTDGENTVDGYDNDDLNFADRYMAYGYPGPHVASPGFSYNGRIFSGTTPTDGEPNTENEVTAAMDWRVVAACNSAKALGITVYTIGLATANTSNPAKVEQMLKDCSNGTGYWFFPSSNSELVDTFKTIAAQLADLRLAK